MTVAAPPQLSVETIEPGLAAGTWLAHDTVMSVGQIMEGGVLSKTVMICEQLAVFPHASVARYVLVNVNRFVQVCAETTSLINDTVAAPPQLSVAVMRAGFGAGIWLVHCTLTVGGHVIAATLSMTVYVIAHVAEFPTPSSAVYVLVIILGLAGHPEPPLFVSALVMLTLLQNELTVISALLGAGT